MVIAVVGDTHGHVSGIQAVLERLQPDCLLFTGDFITDGLKLSSRLGLPFYGVAGNCDRNRTETQEQLLEIYSERILIVHGHQYGVKQSLMRLFYRAEELQATIVLFGHTHVYMAEQIGGIWFVNPGSPSNPRHGSDASYAVLEIDENSFNVSIQYL